jgi:hypothetical protein
MTEFPKRVLVPFWTCPKGHQHKTRDAAQQCIDEAHAAHEKATARAAEMSGQYAERNRAIAIEALSGRTFEEVGHSYGLTRERARQITRAMVKRVDPNNPYLFNRRVGKPLNGDITSARSLREDAERLIALIQQA